jgi:maleamate amidohydrolase
MDAIAHGFRPLVVEECCGDRSQEAHEANLFDIDQKYGDVIKHSEALSFLRSLSPAAAGS